MPVSGGKGHPRRVPDRSPRTGLARRVLALVAAGLIAATLPAVAGAGWEGAAAQPASPGPSGSGGSSPVPAPTGAAIKLLNPSTGYEPGLDPTGEDPPKISDKHDGVDQTYPLVAWVAAPPPSAIVEATLRYEGENEIVIGQLARVGSSNVWELAWDVPQGLATGAASLQVGLYEPTDQGIVERAGDTVEVDMRHKGGGQTSQDSNPDDTAEMTWPLQASPLGFFKPRSGSWRTVIDGKVSMATTRVQMSYSVTPPGGSPQFTPCGTTTTMSFTPTPGDPQSKMFRLVCTLGASDLPSSVTAVAMVALSGDNFSNFPESQEAADVHAVAPYLQDPAKMTVTMSPWVRGLPNGCLAAILLVADDLGRPVQGANVDMHAAGPDDQLNFGAAAAGNAQGPPDRADHPTQSSTNCMGVVGGQQAFHRLPGQSDSKHRESAVAGTNLGRFVFQFYSRTAGTTDLVAWIDDGLIEDEKDLRPPDSDTLDDGEPSIQGHLQWYGAAPVVSMDPTGATGALGECVPYLMKVRSQTAAVAEANVDLHAQSSIDGLRFCTPDGGAPLRAPDKGTHDPIDGGQSRETSATTPTIHAETETDSAGNVQFGLTSPAAGDATITAWLDGEPGVDNDLMDGADPRATATATWADCTSAANASFVNPSGYGPGTTGPGSGTNVSTELDADRAYHVVVRTDCASFAQTIEIQLANGSTFQKLGNATQIPGTDTYEFSWSPVPGDGSHRLRAHVVGAPADQDQTITVNAQDASGGDPTEQADEAVELSQPANGQPAGFERGGTEVRGVASAGAEGVDLYYSKIAAKDTPAGADWISCGYVPLDGAGSAVQPFSGTCALKDPDQPSQVTAVAALTVDCGLGQNGCDAAPGTSARQLPTFKKDSGDAHRVFGYDAVPLVSITPAENEARTGECLPLTLTVADDSSQPLPGENVDVHITGPADDVTFCRPDGASDWHAPAEGGHAAAPGRSDQSAHENASGPDTYHAEGITDSEGRFSFGVTSSVAGDSDVVAWLDRVDDDVAAAEETMDTALMHWITTNATSCTQTGTGGADRLKGTTGPDRICALGGNDRVSGLAGDDVLVGGSGRDTLIGGPGRDVLLGGKGRDRLDGRGGRDRCSGGRHRDLTRRCEGKRRAAARTPDRAFLPFG